MQHNVGYDQFARFFKIILTLQTNTVVKFRKKVVLQSSPYDLRLNCNLAQGFATIFSSSFKIVLIVSCFCTNCPLYQALC